MKTYLGIDVGSVSTKLALVDEKNNVLSALYLRTEGDPIRAIQKGLRQLREEISKNPGDIEIAGVGTTGSARYLAGVISGADLVKNEISAHAKGASFFIPDVKTVIEIGGQDSKIIILENGVVVDFAMNLICLKKDSLITCNHYSQKPIQEIKIGERVLTHTGKFRPVVQVFERQYQGQMLKIEVSNLKKLEITPEHPILGIKREDIQCYKSFSHNNIAICKPPTARTCKKKCTKWRNFSWEPKFILAKEFKKGDFIATPLPIERNSPVSINYSRVETKHLIGKPFKKIDEFVFKPDLFRLLGYYLAEGSILYNRARWDKKTKYPAGIVFVFNIKEQNYIDDIKKIISQNFPDLNIILREKPEHQTVVVEISSKSLAQYIKYLCGAGADKKRLSSELLNLEPSLQKEVLKGFFRGDGQLRKRLKDTSSLNKTGNRYVASTVSEALAYQLYWLLLRNRIKCTLNKRPDKTKGGKYAYLISIYGEEVNKLNDKTLIIAQKNPYKSFIYSKWFFEPIKKIKKYNFNGDVYTLKVRGDNSYTANFLSLKNCAAGTGSFLDAQAFRLGIPVEEFGQIALKSKQPTVIGSRCTVFCESDMIHKQQIGHSREDIIAGLCHGLARNFLANVAKGKKISPPIVFAGGVSENLGMRRAFEDVLGQKIIVPKYNTVLGAIGVAILIKENISSPTKFRGWEVSDQDIKCTSFQCKGCPNLCEVIEARIEGKVVSRWNDRCGKFSSLNPQ